MFVGSVPKPVVEQIIRVTPFDKWGDAYVCCSGSFRVDRALANKYGSALNVHSNDVSLLSAGLGKLAMGESFDIEFVERLAFIEDILGDCSFDDRMAAVVLALEMSKYAGKSDHSKAHFFHFQTNFEDFMEKARKVIAGFREGTRITSFFAGDFRVHAKRALETGGGIVSFPPTYKGGYERLYKFLAENTRWQEPSYDMWNPKDLPGWLDDLDADGLPFCVFSDQVLEGRNRVAEYYSATNKPVYIYASSGGSSLRRATNRAAPFKYHAIDASKITANSRVQVIKADGAQMNFLKDIYLAKSIHHATGQFNFLVYVDGALAGGFILAKSKFGGISELYMLSDFSLTREGRVSKLIPMIAASRDVTRECEKKLLSKIDTIYTTAFTTNPVSMKYRGIYELAKRGDGFLNYKSAIRPMSVQAVFEEWWSKNHVAKTPQQAKGKKKENMSRPKPGPRR